MEQVLCVFDIGKSNKKCVVYSLGLKIIESLSVVFHETPGTNDLEYENVEGLIDWLQSTLNKVSETYDIRSVNISCHGGTYALLNEADQLVLPIFSYTSKWPVQSTEKFNQDFGEAFDLYRSTATPNLGTINIARSVYAFKNVYPYLWSEVQTFLFYPQYLGFRLCGEKAIDCTYLGNHSYLWDFHKNEYSEVCKKLGLLDKLPEELSCPRDYLGEISLTNGKKVPLLVGVHDSNSALYPYFYLKREEFTLLSTGSWCVAMKPNLPYGLDEEDQSRGVYFNIDVNRNFLKTAGNQSGLIYRAFADKLPGTDLGQINDLEKLFTDNDLFVIINQAGMLVGKDMRIQYLGEIYSLNEIELFIKKFPDQLQKTYAALNFSIAKICADHLVGLGVKEEESVFVEGGFVNNTLWKTCLKLLCGSVRFYTSTLEEAGCCGAALLCAESLNIEIDVRELFEVKSFDEVGLKINFDPYLKNLNNCFKGSEKWKLQNQQ